MIRRSILAACVLATSATGCAPLPPTNQAAERASPQTVADDLYAADRAFAGAAAGLPAATALAPMLDEDVVLSGLFDEPSRLSTDEARPDCAGSAASG